MHRMAKDSKETAPGRGVRADAQRNLETLLQAARDVFNQSGVEAPVREIAQRSGLGVGTIYRHFPTRADLIAGVFCHEVDACADTATALAGQAAEGKGLFQWVERYAEFIATRRGLATALSSGDPAYSALPEYFLGKLRPVVQVLVDQATAAGEIRAGIHPDELLYAIAGLCTPLGCSPAPDARRMVALFVDGLRFGARRQGTQDPGTV